MEGKDEGSTYLNVGHTLSSPMFNTKQEYTVMGKERVDQEGDLTEDRCDNIRGFFSSLYLSTQVTAFSCYLWSRDKIAEINESCRKKPPRSTVIPIASSEPCEYSITEYKEHYKILKKSIGDELSELITELGNLLSQESAWNDQYLEKHNPYEKKFSEEVINVKGKDVSAFWHSLTDRDQHKMEYNEITAASSTASSSSSSQMAHSVSTVTKEDLRAEEYQLHREELRLQLSTYPSPPLQDATASTWRDFLEQTRTHHANVISLANQVMGIGTAEYQSLLTP